MPRLCVIIKGNPQYIDHRPIATRYYNAIAAYVRAKGYRIEFDAGADFTEPRKDADFYIGHSRGACRYDYMTPEQQAVFLKFGTPDGIIHPVDLEWTLKYFEKGTDRTPPDEHFWFIPEQKKAIDAMVKIIEQKSHSALHHQPAVEGHTALPLPLYDRW